MQVTTYQTPEGHQVTIRRLSREEMTIDHRAAWDAMVKMLANRVRQRYARIMQEREAAMIDQGSAQAVIGAPVVTEEMQESDSRQEKLVA